MTDFQRPDAAVAIVHARAENSVLLIRRTERANDPWSGHWSLPGGRCEAGDVDALDTALRELHEECGVRLSREQVTEALPLANARRRTGPVLAVAPFVFEVDREMPVLLDAREAVEARWVPVRLLRDHSQHRMSAVPGMPANMHFPTVPLAPVPLWGFTYRLLSDWLGGDTIGGSKEVR